MGEYTYTTYGKQNFVLIPGGEISDAELDLLASLYVKALRESMRETTQYALSVATKKLDWE